MGFSIRLTGLRGQMLTAFALRGATAVFSFAFNWLIARQFGAAGVGSFAVALTTAIMASTIALAGMDRVLVRTVSVARSEGRSGVARSAVQRSLWRTSLTGIALGAVIFILSDLLAARIFGLNAVAPFLAVMAGAVPVLAVTKLTACALRASGKVAVSQAIDGPIGTGLAAAALAGAILVKAAGSALLPAVLFTSFGVVSAATGWFALRRAMENWEPAAPYRESLLLAGLPILVVTLSNLSIEWFAIVTLGANSSTAEAGVFRIAFQIVSMLNLLTVASEAILAPAIAISYSAGDKARIALLSRKSVFAVIVPAIPPLVVMLAAPTWLLGLFGSEFESGAVTLQILALGQLVALLTGPVGPILEMSRRVGWLLGNAVIGAVVAAILCLSLIPQFGLVGAAVAVAASIATRRIGEHIIVRQVVGVRIFGNSLARE